MAVTVSLNPADFALHVMRAPTVAAPAVRGNQMFFDSTPMRLEGFATLQGGVGEAALDWKVGFIQAQWVETNWCSYRGAANTDGSIFIQRGRPLPHSGSLPRLRGRQPHGKRVLQHEPAAPRGGSGRCR